MNDPTQTVARDALRRLSAPHAIAFGSRLLERGQTTPRPGQITFREFLSVARELVAQKPEQSAIYLAALVALDMHTDDSILSARAAPPSAN